MHLATDSINCTRILHGKSIGLSLTRSLAIVQQSIIYDWLSLSHSHQSTFNAFSSPPRGDLRAQYQSICIRPNCDKHIKKVQHMFIIGLLHAFNVGSRTTFSAISLVRRLALNNVRTLLLEIGSDHALDSLYCSTRVERWTTSCSSGLQSVFLVRRDFPKL